MLLHDPTDLDVQFRLLKNSRLTQGDIQSILRALRAIKTRDRAEDEVVASAGEILRQSPEKQRIDPDARDAGTKVGIAISWLEEAQILERHENHTKVFPGSLLVASEEEARTSLLKKLGPDTTITPYLAIISALMSTEEDENLSTDELMGITGQDSRTIAAMLRDLDRWKLLSNDTELGVLFYREPSTALRLQELMRLESSLLEHLREAAPNADFEEWQVLNVRSLCDLLRRDTQIDLDPQRLGRLLTSFAAPFGREGDEQAAHGFFELRPDGHDRRRVRLRRSWSRINDIRQRRMQLSQALIARFESLRKNNALLVTCKQGELEAMLQADTELASLDIKDWDTALSAALLYLDANEVLHLARGKAVFRSAMRIQLHAQASQRRFSRSDYAELSLHYKDKTAQIHVMAEYAKLAIDKIQEAMRFIVEYFSLNWQEFVRRWFAGRKDVLELATTEEAHRRILIDLANPEQQAIVAAPPQGSQLVLAGPGSGKTRVIVHRVAWLLRECLVQPEEIMVLTYNRSAAVEIRRRLWKLVGMDAAGVAIQTLHSLAMRLTGTSYAVALEREENIDFGHVIRQATKRLQQTTTTHGDDDNEASIARDKLLAGLRFVLVDEYQDINGDHYNLISALAGRSLHASDDRLSLMAVGDDDQNIYAFGGADVRYIRQFETDYQAKRFNLLENYRSTTHIIDCASLVITPARQRMKQGQTLRIDHARREQPAGGEWALKDALAQGRVHVLEVPAHDFQEAAIALAELKRLQTLQNDMGHWGSFAVLARKHSDLDAIQTLCRQQGIPVQRITDEPPIPLYSSREGATLLALLRGEKRRTARKRIVLRSRTLARWLRRKYGLHTADWDGNPYLAALVQFIAEADSCSPDSEAVVDELISELYEFKNNGITLSEQSPNAPLMLMTAHRAKGLEFNHVLILGASPWKAADDEERRLFYVAMTRARQTLTICERLGQRHPFVQELHNLPMRSRPTPPALPPMSALRVASTTPENVYISWLGHRNPKDPAHRAIAALRIGDALSLRPRSDGRLGWEITNSADQTVGCMATAFKPTGRIATVRVAAIQVRNDKTTRCPRWELVLPEIEYHIAANGTPPS